MPGLIWLCVLLIVSFHDDGVAVAGVGEFIYNGFTGSNLRLDGAASIAQDGVLTLTTSSHDIQGHGFHHEALPFVPLPFVRSHGVAMYFSSTFVFTITPNNSGHSGEGMAFVISLAPPLAALPGRYLGLSDPYYDDTNRFFAIELDTVTDPEFKDIDDNHVGIDLNNLTSTFFSTAGYYSGDVEDYEDSEVQTFDPLRLSSGNPMQVWVDYDGASMQLDIRLALVPMYKPYSPLLSYTVDLATLLRDDSKSKAGVPTMAYVGFSAATGDKRCGTHQILGWSFNMLGPAKPLNYSALPLKQLRVNATQEASYYKGKVVKWLPAAASSLAVLAGLTACLLLRWWCKIRNSRWDEDWEAELGPRRFAYKDLCRATNGFRDMQLLGKGGFGRVYGGVLACSSVRVAVKRISSESRQGLTQFTAEIMILGRLRHRNLVRLIGYCRHKDELLLVYEYMPNGSLDRYLHTHNRHTVLSWPQRLHIIKGVASGLLYLHEDWEQVILHRDVKASNVLLDGEMNGRLGDFGLARLHDHGADAHTTHVAGTRGYLAPELMRFGKATKATDVFAFGAFILEVACGRWPMGLNARGELLVLVQWVHDVWASGSGAGLIVDSLDPRLVDYVANEAELVLKLGLLCSHPLPAARPGMRLVMRYLDGDLPLPEFSPGYLSIIDVDQVLDEVTPSVANSITGLSGGR
ncbi:L-type lectin-domain containing receptor kinase SIT2-like [Triticum urartu]|uniref:L-type lectin-domain containing receptor kinase SIT2-like n=1 Tax=Triticum urartu TaxID=4572 RepID=UPI0020434E81|nr:L-type lectin-domain containing receptor kinase SIT2-like [Triticum urartu]